MEGRRHRRTWRNTWRHSMKLCRAHLLLSLTISSVFVGLVLGFALRSFQLSSETVRLVNFPGEIFMQVLKMMILPLIFSSLVSALAQMDAREMASFLSFHSALFKFYTGVLLVLAIHPGDPSIKQDLAYLEVQHPPISPLDTFLDVVRNMFPENVVQASLQRVQTKYFSPKKGTPQKILQQMTQQKHGGTPGQNRTAVIMQLVGAFMWLTPFGIVSLISGNLLELDDLSDTAAMLLLYVITVLAGLAAHALVTMPCLYFVFTRRNPFKIVRGMLQALVTAFGTASGGAALPVSMRCMEENLGVDRRITRFVLPLGSTINMDGNALYEAVAVIFIAQLNNVTLTLAEVITVSFIATIASLGLNSVPAGLVSIFVILSTVGLPVKDIPLIITTDWLLDRIRTSINVLGDAFVASTVSHYLKGRLEEADRLNEFHQTIKEEADLLSLHSRKASLARSELGGLPSRNQSTDGSQIISWREQAILDRLAAEVVLNRVIHV
uniref:Amino acid transporter n=1 Tax=Globodera rostochiensis TaxID=31243 RepID=A0A914HW49_GLORO